MRLVRLEEDHEGLIEAFKDEPIGEWEQVQIPAPALRGGGCAGVRICGSRFGVQGNRGAPGRGERSGERP